MNRDLNNLIQLLGVDKQFQNGNKLSISNSIHQGYKISKVESLIEELTSNSTQLNTNNFCAFKTENGYLISYPNIIWGSDGPANCGTVVEFFDNKEKLIDHISNDKGFSEKLNFFYQKEDSFNRVKSLMLENVENINSEKKNNFSNTIENKLREFRAIHSDKIHNQPKIK